MKSKLHRYSSEEGDVLVREGYIKVRKPRRLTCGYEAQKGDEIWQRTIIQGGEVITEEECERCQALSRGYYDEADGPKHGSIKRS